MSYIPEQFVAAGKSNVEAALRAAGIAFEGTERLIDLNLKVARAAFADSAKVAKALASAKDVKDLPTFDPAAVQPALEKATAYARNVYEIASATQAELAKLAEERLSEFNKSVIAELDKVAKAGPAGSDVAVAAVKSAIAAANQAYDSVAKATKQVVELTEANVAAATRQVSDAAKKKAA